MDFYGFTVAFAQIHRWK